MRTSLTHFIRRHAAIASLAIVLPVVACDDASEPLAPSVQVEQEQRQAVGTVITSPASALADFPISMRLGGEEVEGASVEWIFSDGTRQHGARVTKSFADSGLTTVNVRVTDEHGHSYGVSDVIEVGPSIAALGTVMTGIVPGGLNTCAIDVMSAVYCWGSNEHGIIGDGSTTDRLSPTLVVTGGVQFSQISSGFKHSCAISTTNELYCWGRNFSGQLGDSTTTDRTNPTRVATSLKFVSVDVGHEHTCAIAASGAAYCWGSDTYGQLGNGGVKPSQFAPVPVVGNRVYSVIRTGNYHTCALESATNAAYCWGSNALGQVGNGSGGGTVQDKVTMPRVVAGAYAFTQLDAGGSHNCGIAGSSTYCWGSNGSGQNGVATGELCLGTHPCMRNPTPVAVGTLASVGLGTAHSCGLDGATGATYCWGYNAFGQLGNGTTASTSTPTLVLNLSLKTVRGGNGYTCGVGTNNKGYCWGINSQATLGVSDRINRLTPTEVPGLSF